MQYLIDEFLRPGARAHARSDPQFAGFTLDHQMDGLIVGEQQVNFELIAIRVARNQVTIETLRRGISLPFEPGWDGVFFRSA